MLNFNEPLTIKTCLLTPEKRKQVIFQSTFIYVYIYILDTSLWGFMLEDTDNWGINTFCLTFIDSFVR